MNKEKEYFEVNRALWNEKTQHHIASAFYNVEAFLGGASSLNEPELELLGDVTGKSILHLQCHFGQDSLSLARMGASVTGTDISDEAIAYAQQLNEQLGMNTQFVRTDTYDVPNNVHGQFDVVFASYGVIGWLPDMQRWADVVARMLKPGGRFVFVEFHPVVWMYNADFTDIAYSYFNTGPIIEMLNGTYADRNADINMKEVGWNHSLAEVMQALIDAGIHIDTLREYDWSPYNCFLNMKEVESGKWQMPGKEGLLPLIYAMSGTRMSEK